MSASRARQPLGALEPLNQLHGKAERNYKSAGTHMRHRKEHRPRDGSRHRLNKNRAHRRSPLRQAFPSRPAVQGVSQRSAAFTAVEQVDLANIRLQPHANAARAAPQTTSLDFVAIRSGLHRPDPAHTPGREHHGRRSGHVAGQHLHHWTFTSNP
jgi:hypothetical protein